VGGGTLGGQGRGRDDAGPKVSGSEEKKRLCVYDFFKEEGRGKGGGIRRVRRCFNFVFMKDQRRRGRNTVGERE